MGGDAFFGEYSRHMFWNSVRLCVIARGRRTAYVCTPQACFNHQRRAQAAVKDSEYLCPPRLYTVAFGTSGRCPWRRRWLGDRMGMCKCQLTADGRPPCGGDFLRVALVCVYVRAGYLQQGRPTATAAAEAAAPWPVPQTSLVADSAVGSGTTPYEDAVDLCRLHISDARQLWTNNTVFDSLTRTSIVSDIGDRPRASSFRSSSSAGLSLRRLSSSVPSERMSQGLDLPHAHTDEGCNRHKRPQQPRERSRDHRVAHVLPLHPDVDSKSAR